MLSRVQVFQQIPCQVCMLDAPIFSNSHTRPLQGPNPKEITLLRTHSVGCSSLRSGWTQLGPSGWPAFRAWKRANHPGARRTASTSEEPREFGRLTLAACGEAYQPTWWRALWSRLELKKASPTIRMAPLALPQGVGRGKAPGI